MELPSRGGGTGPLLPNFGNPACRQSGTSLSRPSVETNAQTPNPAAGLASSALPVRLGVFGRSLVGRRQKKFNLGRGRSTRTYAS